MNNNPDSHESRPSESAGTPDPSADDLHRHAADQLLIAYLDGELDDPAAAELESRLANDPGRND